MVENEMRPAIVGWFRRNGYYDAHECLIGGYCDVIGCMWDQRDGRKPPSLLEMICVELKMRRIQEVISQAKGNHYHCNMSFCAMPAGFCERIAQRTRQKFIDACVGLLAVDGKNVTVEIESTYNNWMPHEVFRKRLWAFKLRNKR